METLTITLARPPCRVGPLPVSPCARGRGVCSQPDSPQPFFGRPKKGNLVFSWFAWTDRQTEKKGCSGEPDRAVPTPRHFKPVPAACTCNMCMSTRVGWPHSLYYLFVLPATTAATWVQRAYSGSRPLLGLDAPLEDLAFVGPHLVITVLVGNNDVSQLEQYCTNGRVFLEAAHIARPLIRREFVLRRTTIQLLSSLQGGIACSHIKKGRCVLLRASVGVCE